MPLLLHLYEFANALRSGARADLAAFIRRQYAPCGSQVSAQPNTKGRAVFGYPPEH